MTEIKGNLLYLQVPQKHRSRTHLRIIDSQSIFLTEPWLNRTYCSASLLPASVTAD
jgi:hypothetical protein